MTHFDIKTINVQQLHTLLNHDTTAISLIDVREHDEWQNGAIPKAIHIPNDVLANQISALIKNQEQPIYLYCHAGVRSLYAAYRLKELGYTTVYSVDGGIIDWVKHGYTLDFFK